jgi:hypothetical protein
MGALTINCAATLNLKRQDGAAVFTRSNGSGEARLDELHIWQKSIPIRRKRNQILPI